MKQYGKRKNYQKRNSHCLEHDAGGNRITNRIWSAKSTGSRQNAVCGKYTVTEANASDVLGNKTISYQASAHTLTLNGANLTTPMKAGKYIYGIRYEGAGQTLNLVLNGTNTITTGNVTDAKECYGIYLSMNDTLKISGTGTLKVTAGNARMTAWEF